MNKLTEQGIMNMALRTWWRPQQAAWSGLFANLWLIVCCASAVVMCSPQVSAAGKLPQFRQPTGADVSASQRKVRRIRFAIDEHFPPFAYRDAAGALTGFLPLLTDEICRDLKVSCEYVTRDVSTLQVTLGTKQADAVIYMSRPGPIDIEKLDFTRPFLRPFGRFAGRTSSPIDKVTIRALAGRRIGVPEGTSHASFVKAHFNRSRMVPFATRPELYEAARTGSVDLIFDDAFRLMFWMQGSRSRDCCHFIGNGFLEKTTFSQPLTFAVRREDADLRKLLDHGLDRMQSSGRLEVIYNRFFPQSPY